MHAASPSSGDDDAALVALVTRTIRSGLRDSKGGGVRGCATAERYADKHIGMGACFFFSSSSWRRLPEQRVLAREKLVVEYVCIQRGLSSAAALAGPHQVGDGSASGGSSIDKAAGSAAASGRGCF